MPPRFGRRMARFNRHVTNRVARPLAPWLPAGGVIVHVGRRTGRRYRTPVNVFPHDDGYVIALVYGTDSDWVRNVRAAGGCELVTRRRRQHLVSPEIRHDERLRLVPAAVRPALRFMRVSDFLILSRVPSRRS